MSKSADSTTSKELWKLVRNGIQSSSSDTLLRYPYKPVQRRRFSSIEYLRSVTGAEPENVTVGNYNERYIDGDSKTYCPLLRRVRTEAEVRYEETIFPVPSVLRAGNKRSVSQPALHVKEISACIRLGSMYSSAGYGWTDQQGNFASHILDKWPDCAHCPDKDKQRTLSEVLLSVKPREEITAVGYEAHIIYLNSAARQRKKFLYKNNFTELFEQSLTTIVVDDARAMKLNVHHLCVGVIRFFRQAVLNDIWKRELPLMAPPGGTFSWTIIVDDEAVQKNITAVLPDVPLANCRVVLLRDIIAAHIGEEITKNQVNTAGNSLRRYMSTPALCRSPSQNTQAADSSSCFILLNTGAYVTEVTAFSLHGTILYPIVSRNGPFGGQTVSDGFYKFLGLMFGDELLQSYKKDNYEGHVDLVCAIEKAKRAAQKHQSLSVHLPFSFSQHFKKRSARKDRLSDQAHRMGCRFNSASNSVILEPGTVMAIFLAVVNQITALLEEANRDEDSGDSTPIYLTGGFSQSAIYRDLLREAFPLRHFMTIEDSATVLLTKVAESGLTVGRRRRPLKTLQSMFTVGVTAAARCDRNVVKATSLDETAFLCNAFVPFVRKNEYLVGRDHSSTHSFFAASPTQDSILIRVFFTGKVEIGNVFEDNMECVSQLQLHVPQEKRGVSTGKLFVFHVVVRFVQEPEGIIVTVKDADGIAYGCTRILRSVTY